MLYNISKKSGSCHEIKNIKKIRAKASNNSCDSSSDSFSDDLDYDSSLASDGSWYTHRQPTVRKNINKLDHVVTDNLKTTKDQLNEAINNEPNFDTDSFARGSHVLAPMIESASGPKVEKYCGMTH